MEQAIMIGLDIAKNVFEVHGRNAAGEVVLRRTVKRGDMEKVVNMGTVEGLQQAVSQMDGVLDA